MRCPIRFKLVLLFAAFFCACQQPQDRAYWPLALEKEYSKPLPPGTLALRKIDPSAYPDFSQAHIDRSRVQSAVAHSLEYLAKPSSQRYFPYGEITHRRAVSSLSRFAFLLDEMQSGAQLNEAIRREFDVYQSVGWDDRGTVFFTGYYCPIFDGRKERDQRFRYPLYGLPNDLAKGAEGRTLGRKLADNRLVPYYTRREIESSSGLLSGLEIAWLEDPFEAYVATVQGSVKIRLQNGSLYELGYAGNNGYDYTAVGKLMIDDGVIESDHLSLQAMMHYFAEHPGDVQRYCWQNDRFVFFRESIGGPFGSLNVPVLPYCTIATDKEVYPRACLAYIETIVPRKQGDRVVNARFNQFVLDQDTGGAIRAAGRCDIFVGVGLGAEALAGRTGAEGKLFYLFLRE